MERHRDLVMTNKMQNYSKLKKQTKTGSQTSTVICLPFQTNKTNQTIPNNWSKGTIVKIPQKGDLTYCNNWRGFTLFSITSKILCKIIFK